jgi:hypothetical protein
LQKAKPNQAGWILLKERLACKLKGTKAPLPEDNICGSFTASVPWKIIVIFGVHGRIVGQNILYANQNNLIVEGSQLIASTAGL